MQREGVLVCIQNSVCGVVLQRSLRPVWKGGFLKGLAMDFVMIANPNRHEALL